MVVQELICSFYYCIWPVVSSPYKLVATIIRVQSKSGVFTTMNCCYNDELHFLKRSIKMLENQEGLHAQHAGWRSLLCEWCFGKLMFEGLRNACQDSVGTFLPAMKQIGTVAARLGLFIDPLSSWCPFSLGFAVGNKAAFDMNDPEAVVSRDGALDFTTLTVVSAGEPI